MIEKPKALVRFLGWSSYNPGNKCASQRNQQNETGGVNEIDTKSRLRPGKGKGFQEYGTCRYVLYSIVTDKSAPLVWAIKAGRRS